MPNIFKALASTMVWASFVGAWIIILITLVNSIANNTMWDPGAEGGLVLLGWMALGIFSGLISVIIMKLRKMLE